MHKIFVAWTLVGGLLVIGIPSVSAQAGRAEVTGTVFDQDKAVVPGATVTAVNMATGVGRTVTSGEEGRYILTTLTPGSYRIVVELAGFQTQTMENVTVSVGQEMHLDFTLRLGSLREDVTVTGEAPVVEVTSSRIGTNISSGDIDTLPTQGRNQLALMQLVPGLTPSLEPGSFDGAQFNANGREAGSNLFLIDGIYNNDDRLGGGWGYQARVTLDTVAEYQVLAHQYAAEYGGAGGVVVNAISRSGSNQHAGRAFYYLQDDKLNATKYFLREQGEKNPDSGNKIYGFNAGGPIVRNKLFWFFNLERDAVDYAVSLVFPAEAAPLATNFSDVTTQRVINTFLKTDYQMSNSQNLSFKWLREAVPTINEDWEELRFTRDGTQHERDMDDQVIAGTWTSIFGSRATNELKAAHVREDLINGGDMYFSQDGKHEYIGLNGRDPFDLGADNRHPDYASGPRSAHDRNKIKTYTVDDIFTLTKMGWGGDHTFKTGLGYSHNGAYPRMQGAMENGRFTFLDNEPFDPANPFTYPSRFQLLLGETEYISRDWRMNSFVQDKWQLPNDLTLNFGLRYDYQNITKTKTAFAPRFGIAWDPTGTGRTAIRAGAGKFFEYQLTSVVDTLLAAQVITKTYLFDTGQDTSPTRGVIPSAVCLQPTGNKGLAVIGPACRAYLENLRNQVAGSGFVNLEPTVDGDRRLGYVWQLSGGVEHELMKNLGVTVDYVGVRGRQQTGLIDINEGPVGANGRVTRLGAAVFDPTSVLIPAEARNTNFLRVLQFQTRDDLTNDYDSLEFSANKRYSNRWSGRVAYTLARSRNVGTTGGRTTLVTKRFLDDLNPRGDYGIANENNTHALSFSLNASPWRGLGAGAMFRYYSGYPINETTGIDSNGDRDNFERPIRGRDDATRPILSPVDANGQAIRNGIPGESQTLLDLRFQYIFNMQRRQTLGLFWEIYNALDKVNFGNPVGVRRNTYFMVPTNTGDMRTMQLGIRYTF